MINLYGVKYIKMKYMYLTPPITEVINHDDIS